MKSKTLKLSGKMKVIDIDPAANNSIVRKSVPLNEEGKRIVADLRKLMGMKEEGFKITIEGELK